MTWEDTFKLVHEMDDTKVRAKLIVTMQTLEMILEAKDGKHLFSLDDALKTARIVLAK